MIQTIEDILRDLLIDQITLSKAVALIQTHIDTAIDADGLRDHFAGQAMEAMISGSWPDTQDRAEIAKRSYLMADAMMEARA